MVIDPEPNEVDKVEAICDLIYDYLQYLQTHFSSFDTYSFKEGFFQGPYAVVLYKLI